MVIIWKFCGRKQNFINLISNYLNYTFNLLYIQIYKSFGWFLLPKSFKENKYWFYFLVISFSYILGIDILFIPQITSEEKIERKSARKIMIGILSVCLNLLPAEEMWKILPEQKFKNKTFNIFPQMETWSLYIFSKILLDIV